MAACPRCHRTDWHEHADSVAEIVDSTRSSELLDAWEDYESKLAEALAHVELLAAQAESVRERLALKGIIVTSQVVESRPIEGMSTGTNVDSPVVPSAPVAEAPKSRFLDVTPKRRNPAADARAAHPQTPEEAAIARIRQSDEAEERAAETARAARLPVQMPAYNTDSREDPVVADIRRASMEDVPNDGPSLAAIVARGMEMARGRTS